MNVYEMFETDKASEEKGIVIDYGEFNITIARSGGANQKYNKILESLTKPYRRAIQTETIDPEIVKKLIVEAHARAVVIGWDGIKDRSGKKMEYSVENCIKLFTDLPDLFDDIREQATKTSLFKKEITKEEMGN